jgi:hypothetical protein
MRLQTLTAIALTASLFGCSGARPAVETTGIRPTTAAVADAHRSLATTPSCEELSKPERQPAIPLLRGGMCTE